MKKVLLVVLSLILMLVLVACSNNSNNVYTTSFKARIIESNGDTVIVEPLENEDIRRSADKISVGIGNVKKYVPEVLPEGTLVEIVYDGNINETYPAQINVLGFRTIMEESEIPTVVAYANWSPNESNLIRDCLNSDTMSISSVRHLPVFKFETKAELDEFKNKYKDDFTMNQGYDENPSFNEETANYDDDFFKDHTLILAYISAGSGSFRYGVSEVTKENGTLTMIVTQLNNPEVYTDDMSGWFLMAEVTKEYLKDCTKYDAQFVKDTNLIILTTNEIEESSQMSFELSREKSDALRFMVTNTTNWNKETCDGIPYYTFEIDNNKYGIEVYSSQIHIVDLSNGKGEAVFTGDEYSELENILTLKDILDSRLENVITTEDTIIIPNGKNENESQHIYRITKFVENAQNGIEDEIKIIQYTIEGDPITKDVRYNSSNGTFGIITDTTQDKFGVQEVYNNVYDSSYKAEAGKMQINGENYYEFKLVSGENDVSICRFMYKHSSKNL
ncbi:MAG: DUF4362 domain-containing protein [Bacilli bacterium]|nr:DUF4362 domain-containing protein [Bacilli bacterium]